jgi:hypothetical protein
VVVVQEMLALAEKEVLVLVRTSAAAVVGAVEVASWDGLPGRACCLC